MKKGSKKVNSEKVDVKVEEIDYLHPLDAVRLIDFQIAKDSDDFSILQWSNESCTNFSGLFKSIILYTIKDEKKLLLAVEKALKLQLENIPKVLNNFKKSYKKESKK